MTDSTNRDERRSALDEFASTRPGEGQGALAPALVGAQPTNLVFGAQAVAVRRDERQVLARIRELAAAAGGDWYYRFPVRNRKENRTDWIEGPSIKLANDLARLYGNCEVDCRAQDLGSVILYHARFVDLETGYALTRPFQQRKGAAKLGGSDEQRREDITFQIGASKAIRNVVVNALQTFSDFAFDEAKQALVDKIGKNIERWRADTLDQLKVDVKRVEAVIGRPAAEWLAPDVARVRAMGKAIEDGMASWDETFPPLGQEERVDRQTGEVLDDFATGKVSSGIDADAAQTAGVDQAAAADRTSPPTDAAAAKDQPEIIDKLLALAADKIPAQERLEALDISQTGLLDRYPTAHEFVKQAIITAAKVVKGELPMAAARKYLESLLVK